MNIEHELLRQHIQRQFGSLDGVPDELHSFVRAIDSDYQRLTESNGDVERARAEFLHDVYRELDVAIFVIDVDEDNEFRFAGLNDAHERLTGLNSDAIKGKTPHDIADHITLAGAETVRRNYESCRSTRKVVEYQERLDLDGRETWWLTRLTPLFDGRGRVSRIIGTALDITERMQAAERLRQSEERWQFALEGSAAAVWDWDIQSGEVYLSPRWGAMLGYRDGEVSSSLRELHRLVHPDDQERAAAAMIDHLRGQAETYSIEHRLQHRDGRYIWIAALGKVMARSSDGRALRVVGTHSDISSRKETEEGLRKAEEKSRAILAAIPDVMFQIGPDGRIVDCHIGTENPLNLEFEELIGQSVADVFPQRLAGQLLAAVAEARSTEQIQLLEFQMPGLNSSLCDFEARIIATSLGDVLVIGRDITERKRSGERIRQSRMQLTEAQHLAKIGSWQYDLRTGQMEWSDELFNIFGAERHSAFLDIEQFYDYIHPDDIGQLRERIETTMQSGVAFETEHRIVKQNGEERILLARGRVLHNEHRQIIKLLGIGQDITERKRDEQELIKAKIAAEEAARAKAEFLATMSHEIRTPMNGVIGMTDLVMETSLDEEQRDCIETIRVSGEALLNVINDILDYSKIESGKLIIEQRPLDLRTCIEEVFDILALRAHAKDLELLYEVPEDLPPTILGDATRLRQILVNLVGNAIKFTQAGEVIVTAELSSGPSSTAELRISVKDTGIGIPDSKRSLLFQPFSQVDSTTTREYGGTGLGLAICAKLVKAMNGEIDVDSTEGKGTNFFFSIRVGIADDGSEQAVRPHSKLEGMTFAIIDPNANNRKILSAFLRRRNVEIQCCRNSAALLEALRNGTRIDAILLDASRKNTEWSSFVQQLQETEAKLRPAILLMAPLGSNDKLFKSRSGQVQGVIPKPLHYSRLELDLGAMLQSFAQDSRPQPVAPIQEEAKDEIAGLRVLVAEDNPVNQKLIRALLLKFGSIVSIAANGLEAIQQMRDHDFDIILMDIQMPLMDGLTATRSIRREIAADRQPAIVALTANAMPGDREICIEAGMDDYLAKPLRMQKVRRVLSDCRRKALR